MGKSLVLDKSFDFAVRIVNSNKFLVSDKKKFALSKQVLRSGIAIGTLYREAQHTESNAGITHKLSIALIETNETNY